jgi:arylsulfatase A-like enzyme
MAASIARHPPTSMTILHVLAAPTLKRGIAMRLTPRLACLACAMVACQAGAADSPAAKRPHIVIVLADDMGWRDTGYSGNPVVKTPHLDRMAAAGVRFDNFYAGQQMCSPGRFALMCGRTPFRCGLHHLGATRPQEITIAKALKTAGYQTAHFGKWHLGGGDTSPVKMGFDQSTWSMNYFDIGAKLKVNDTNETVSLPEGVDSSIATMDLALDYIRKAARGPAPFFAYVCFGSPHAPHRAAEEFRAMYKDQADKADFWGEISGLDAAVGKLREELRRLKIADETLLWFTSDNGGISPMSMDPAGRGKGQVGVRTVACLEWPARVRQPIRTSVTCGHVDMYPTILDLVGVTMPNQPVLDGISLVPLLDGSMRQRPAPMGFLLWNGAGKATFDQADFVKDVQGVWIDGRYKLMVTPPGHRAAGRGRAEKPPEAGGEPSVRLYDLEADPAEKEDAAPRHAEVVAKMRRDLERWQRSVRDSYDGKDYVK